MNIILIFIIAISLSMDAFSLALAYGTLSFTKTEIKKVSIIVGIYHFLMPLIGNKIGSLIINILNVNINYLTAIIFIIIGINMIIDNMKKTSIKKMKDIEMFLFGFAVSIDSFTVGIGIKSISNKTILSALIFSIVSLILTYIGLTLGNKLYKLIGKITPIIGGTVLIILGLTYIF